MTFGRPSATANPTYTAAIKAMISAWTVAAGSHHKTSGAATQMSPHTTPHATTGAHQLGGCTLGGR